MLPWALSRKTVPSGNSSTAESELLAYSRQDPCSAPTERGFFVSRSGCVTAKRIWRQSAGVAQPQTVAEFCRSGRQRQHLLAKFAYEIGPADEEAENISDELALRETEFRPPLIEEILDRNGHSPGNPYPWAFVRLRHLIRPSLSSTGSRCRLTIAGDSAADSGPRTVDTPKLQQFGSPASTMAIRRLDVAVKKREHQLRTSL